MIWHNDPAVWEERDGVISLTTLPGTDLWREPIDGGIRNTAHEYTDRIEGDFTAEVSVSGNYGHLYDQAGLIVRFDGENWMKCGVEYMEGRQYASVVVARGWSDWSIVEIDNPPELRIRTEYVDGTLKINMASGDTDYKLMRKTFFPGCSGADVGIMAASPKGPGLAVRFSGFSIRQ